VLHRCAELAFCWWYHGYLVRSLWRSAPRTEARPGGTLRTARGRADPPTQRWVVNQLGRVLYPFCTVVLADGCKRPP